MNEQEYKQKIKEAFDKKDYGDVMFRCVDFMSFVYAEMKKDPRSSGDDLGAGSPFAYKYFAEHDMAPILWMKAIAAMYQGDDLLSGRMFEDSIKSLPESTTFVEPFISLAFVQDMWGQKDLATETIRQGRARNPAIGKEFDRVYDEYLASSSTPEHKEAFRKAYFLA